MISLQTNVDSLNAQRNLNIDNTFQSKTIQQLTSGYRINSSGDDAAGLAVANGYASTVAELTQGVNNANDGTSQLQIVDGGLSNISTILNRLKTLATESASSTFTGARSTLNQEYQSLLTEITRQATNINLNSGGSFNNLLSVFIGGGTGTNNTVQVNLSGAQNAVDATSLGLTNTNVLNGGVGLGGNTQRLDAPGAPFLANNATQTFTFNLATTTGAQQVTATLTGTTAGLSESGVITQLNSDLNQYGITAGVDTNGLLQFSGATAFNVSAGAASVPGTGAVSDATTAVSNTSNYLVEGAATWAKKTENLTFQVDGKSIVVAFDGTNNATLPEALTTINNATAQYGLYAIENASGNGIEFQSATSFSATTNVAAGTFTNAGTISATVPSTGTTNNATAAITAIDSAIQALGVVQGSVGAGENTLAYATSLAQSQITSFSSAESQIKDADVAQQAANLTKAQVLVQTSVAALAQANSEPQAILKLLQ
jgi:flagellin